VIYSADIIYSYIYQDLQRGLNLGGFSIGLHSAPLVYPTYLISVMVEGPGIDNYTPIINAKVDGSMIKIDGSVIQLIL